ncbi:choice-of-anchor D domain-containing protein [Granulicella sibirica]|uniref:Uncharacterized protein n=1 Tax=Granulicella sibirica TaxID=2479048 RepID=A0A4Q0SXR5_9BACT|nr:choice-of-anchor D domain-containing protein [Granulicella sibirica]RXH54790.1 hypothetical protein GRAN_3894 [Granulicella sibirica]
MILFFSFVVLLPQLRAQQVSPITTNLLTNPGAESGSIAGWTIGGNGTPTVDSGTFDPGITPHTGNYDFLGHDGPSDSLSQTVSLLTQGVGTSDLDSGTLYATLSFWEQGLNQGTLSDDASITLNFLDGSGNSLGTANSGEVDSHDNAWMNFRGSYLLPVGTRSITYTMNFVRHVGSDLDAFVDDNLLVLSVPSFALSPTSLDFGNQKAGVPSAAQVVAVSNPGPRSLNIDQIILSLGSNPSDFTQTNNCPSSLGPSGSCQLSVVFTPHGVGLKTAGIAIFGDETEQAINVSGTGTGGILQVNPGSLKTIAGNGIAGDAGDGGPATAAELNQPNGIAFDSKGNLYIADDVANVVRKVDSSGNITAFAGLGTAGYSGDGGPALRAQLYGPDSVAVDAADNVYIQDTLNNVIRKVNSDGVITTFAGTGAAGHAGDGGPATAARLNQNQGARFDKSGNLFVPQCGGPSIRKIDTTGVITTVAGNFTPGFGGDGGPAIGAMLNCPSGVAIDTAGNFYIADDFNNRIRKVDISGTITTIAGDGNAGFSGDGGASTAAELNLPNDIAIDASGNLYIADSGNNRIRKIDTTGIITTVAGGLQDAGSAGVNTPLSLNLDASGNLYFSDSGNSKVQELFPAGIKPFAATMVGASAPAQTVTISNIGNVDATIASAASFSLGGNATDFALSGGTCLSGATLPANGGSCTLQITFTPVAAGLRTLSISIADNALNSPQSFVISGTGTQGVSTLTWPAPASIPYGTALTSAQLNAVATGASGTSIAGSYIYTPAAGTILEVGVHTLTVAFTSSTPSYSNATAAVQITVTQATPIVAWPSPGNISYGTPLSATQLNAAAAGVAGSPVSGTYTYAPAAGTVLGAGIHTLTVAFTSTDPNYANASSTVTITVVQAAPVITWPAPASIPLGTPLSATQLDATATGIGGAALPGVFTYAPPAGTVLPSGSQALTATFKPTDSVDYVSAVTTVQILIAPLTLTSVNPGTARVGDPDTVVTITGSGFLASSVALVNGTPVATTFVNATTLTAVIPAADFAKTGTLQIVVSDPGISSVSASLPLSVIPATPAVTLSGPSATTPGSQPSLVFTITNPYPVPLTASFNLLFAPAVTPAVDDPAIQFAGGGRNFTFTVAANSIVTPAIQLQAGTVAGTITVPLTLTAQGIDVTPTTLQPVVIVIPRAVPVVSTTTVTRNGSQLSVAIHGFSNTREVTTAAFQFAPAAGATINTPDVTAPVTPLFTTWFTSATSAPYGSTFTYTQVFDVSDDATNVGSVQVILTNSVGTSVPVTSQ